MERLCEMCRDSTRWCARLSPRRSISSGSAPSRVGTTMNARSDQEAGGRRREAGGGRREAGGRRREAGGRLLGTQNLIAELKLDQLGVRKGCLRPLNLH